jgi:hypothetical protein
LGEQPIDGMVLKAFAFYQTQDIRHGRLSLFFRQTPRQT